MEDSSNQRIRLLDILRGFAILGTLGTNIWIFAHLGDISYVFTFDHAEWWSSIDHFIRFLVLFLVNGKLLGLLTIMFGIGLEMKYRQSLRKGTTWPGMYLWISLILFTEGFIHFLLVMEYDILMSYAVTAIIVSFIVKRGDQAIKKTLLWAGGFHATMVLFILIVSIGLNMSGANNSLGDMEKVTLLYKEGSWLEQVEYRLLHFWELRSEAIFVIPMNITLFLTGILLMRSGAFLPNENGRRIRKKMLRAGFILGIPLNLLTFVPGGIFDIPVRYLFAPVLSVGYIALIAKLVERKENFWLWNRLEDAGKMSLSCYVFQNILASMIFYGWGLGAGGNVHSLMVVAVWFMISIIQILFARVWLQRFRYGPMESARRYFAGISIGGYIK